MEEDPLLEAAESGRPFAPPALPGLNDFYNEQRSTHKI